MRLDQPEGDALLFEEDGAEIHEDPERLRQDGGLSGDSRTYPAAEDDLFNQDSNAEAKQDVMDASRDELYLLFLDSIAEAKQDVMDALRDEDPEKLYYALQLASRDRPFVGAIPETTFIEILRILDPRIFIDPYKQSPRDFLGFMSSMRKLLRKRRSEGFKKRIMEYKWILNCIRYTGNGTAARSVWKDMIKGGVKPDTSCYNFYLEALCWSNAYDRVERKRLRVIPYHMRMRLPVKWGKRLGSRWARRRRTGFMGYMVGRRGLKREALNLFSKLVNTGIVADETTFCHLMTAMAREGDLEGPKSILRKVWDVDVDAPLPQDESAMHLVETLPVTSPVYPSEQLLFTVAHIFGINNDIPMALRVVDLISRKYSLRIPQKVWAELLERTFVLATPRYGARRSDGSQLGQLPLQSVENLWNTMVSQAYIVKPTTSMRDYLVKSLCRRDMVAGMLSNMRLGRQDWLATRVRLYREIRLLRKAEANRLYPANFRTSIEAMRKKVRRLQLYEARDFAIIRHWVRLLFAGRRWIWERGLRERGSNRPAWQLEGAPTAMDEWRRFKPRRGFAYSTYAGRLHFDPREDFSILVRRTESIWPGVTIVQRRFRPRIGFAYSISAGRLHFKSRKGLSIMVRGTESIWPGVTIVQSRFKFRKGFAYGIKAGRLHFNSRKGLSIVVRGTKSIWPGVTIVQRSKEMF